jgi:hypothetical protein
MRASAQAWLAKNVPQVLQMIGGSLNQNVYTFARYMHSEVGSGTIEERVAVGEAGMNQARLRAGLTGNLWTKLNVMLIPNGRYGAIHCSAAACASLSKPKPPDCNCAGRWAATTRDPSVMALLLAHLVVSGGSGNFANGAQTQWGPEYLKNPNGSRMGTGTTRARVESFVRYAATKDGGSYYWVGPLPGVDPWHTWLSAKNPAGIFGGHEALVQRGIEALALAPNGRPVRATWSTTLPTCRGGFFTSDYGLNGNEIVLVGLASIVGLAGAIYFNRWLGHPELV